jgi:hypothetical protein
MKKEIKKLAKKLTRNHQVEENGQEVLFTPVFYQRKQQQMYKQYATAQVFEDEDYFFEVEDN